MCSTLYCLFTLNVYILRDLNDNFLFILFIQLLNYILLNFERVIKNAVFLNDHNSVFRSQVLF